MVKLELLKTNLYREKLEILKLERELDLPPSRFTIDFINVNLLENIN